MTGERTSDQGLEFSAGPATQARPAQAVAVATIMALASGAFVVPVEGAWTTSSRPGAQGRGRPADWRAGGLGRPVRHALLDDHVVRSVDVRGNVVLVLQAHCRHRHPVAPTEH